MLPVSPVRARRRHRHHPFATAAAALALLVGPVVGVAPASAATDEPPAVVEPTTDPTVEPTSDPTSDPTVEPTSDPTSDPIAEPTSDPTSDPTVEPTADPTTEPTQEPAPVVVVAPAATALVPSGSVAVGRTVEVQPRPTTWQPAAGLEFSFRWFAGETVVDGARTASFTPGPGLVGTALSVEVTGTLPAADPGSTPVSATVRVPLGTVAPGAASGPTPTISGTARVGAKVTAQPGTWPSGTRLAYRWYADGRAIPGADGRTLTLAAAQRGDRLAVKVTGTRTGYATVTRTSAARTVAAGILREARPTIAGLVGGKAKVGRTLTAKPRVTAWSPDPTRVTYRWKIDGRPISGATRSTYTPKSGQAGKKLTVTVTGSKAGYTSEQATSTSAVVAKPFSRTAKPRISGTVRIGSTLRVVRGNWNPDPTSFTYRWTVGGKTVAGATRSTYKVRALDLGKRVTVTVTGHRKANLTTSRTSAKTARVQLPKPAVTRAGTFKVGRDIKPGTYVAYAWGDTWCQWERRSNTATGAKGGIANDYGYGQRIVTIKSSDEYFRTAGCGAWYKFSPVGGLQSATSADGVFDVGTQLRPGLYETNGPEFDDNACHWTRLRSYAGYTGPDGKNVIARGSGRDGSTVRIRSSDVGFETFGCRWTRIGD